MFSRVTVGNETKQCANKVILKLLKKNISCSLKRLSKNKNINSQKPFAKPHSNLLIAKGPFLCTLNIYASANHVPIVQVKQKYNSDIMAMEK